jgi:hypothetical protein
VPGGQGSSLGLERRINGLASAVPRVYTLYETFFAAFRGVHPVVVEIEYAADRRGVGVSAGGSEIVW